MVRARQIAAIAVPSVTFFVLACIFFGNLFPLSEYRQWIEGHGFINPLIAFEPQNIFAPQGFGIAFTRSFSLSVAAFMGQACGHNFPCHDVFQIGLVALAGVFLGVTLFRLLPEIPPLFTACAVAFFLFSVPVLDGVSWQATLHDKLSVFFSALAVMLTSLVPLRARRRVIVGFNIVLFIVIVATYNSKEASFSLIFSLIGLLFLRFWFAPERTVRTSLARTMTLLALPVAYALFHIGVVLQNRLFMNPAEEARVTSGSASFNFYHYIVYLFNVEPELTRFNLYPYAAHQTIVNTAVIITVLAALAGLLVFLCSSRRVFMLWIWALASFGLAFAIPLRTTATSAFYLQVPELYLAFLFFFTVAAVWLRCRATPLRPLAGILSTCTIFVHVVNLFQSAGPYEHMASMSANFVDALRAVSAVVDKEPAPLPLTIYWPYTEPRAYFMIGNPGNRTIAPYVLPESDPIPKVATYDQQIRDIGYDLPAPKSAPAPTGISLILGTDLKMTALMVNGRSVQPG